MSKSNVNEATDRMTRVVAAIKAANCPDYVVSGMTSLMPKNWLEGSGGPKLTREQLVIAGLCTKNTAGCEGGFHAGELRENGMSLSELSYSFNCGPAHNHSKAISQGNQNGNGGSNYFYREQIGKSRWRLTFTAKGEKFIMAKLAALTATVAVAADKPVKQAKPVTGKAKPKKATKVAPTVEPTTEAPTVTVTPEANQTPEPVTVDTTITYSRETDGSVTETVTPTDLTALAEHFNK